MRRQREKGMVLACLIVLVYLAGVCVCVRIAALHPRPAHPSAQRQPQAATPLPLLLLLRAPPPPTAVVAAASSGVAAWWQPGDRRWTTHLFCTRSPSQSTAPFWNRSTMVLPPNAK